MASAMTLAALIVRVFPLPTVAARLGIRLDERDAAGTSATPDVHLTPAERRNVRAAQRVGQLWPTRHGTCLYEALAIGAMLRRSSPRLALGVARADETIRAHAWIVIDGRTIGARHGFSTLSSTTIRS